MITILSKIIDCLLRLYTIILRYHLRSNDIRKINADVGNECEARSFRH